MSYLIHVDADVIEKIFLSGMRTLDRGREGTREPFVEPRDAGPSTHHLLIVMFGTVVWDKIQRASS